MKFQRYNTAKKYPHSPAPAAPERPDPASRRPPSLPRPRRRRQTSSGKAWAAGRRRGILLRAGAWWLASAPLSGGCGCAAAGWWRCWAGSCRGSFGGFLRRRWQLASGRRPMVVFGGGDQRGCVGWRGDRGWWCCCCSSSPPPGQHAREASSATRRGLGLVALVLEWSFLPGDPADAWEGWWVVILPAWCRVELSSSIWFPPRGAVLRVRIDRASGAVSSRAPGA